MINRSFQSLLPFILATLGCLIIRVAAEMPLFEWQISELTKDFASTYEITIASSPWTAYLGDSFDEMRYMLRHVSVTRSRMSCLGGDYHFTAIRSVKDATLERLFNMSTEDRRWLFRWGYVEIGITIPYIWLFLMWNVGRRGWIYALVQTTIAGFIFLAGPFRSSPGIANDFGFLDCHGTLTLAVILSKVYYETLAVLLIGILLELGGMVVILREIMKAIIQRKESAKLAVG